MLFWFLAAAIGAAIVRRFGVLNYLEVFFIIIVWFLIDLFLDLVVTTSYTGYTIFSRADFWLVYLFLGLAVLFFHKKRHIQIRKELHASHSGHH